MGGHLNSAKQTGSQFCSLQGVLVDYTYRAKSVGFLRSHFTISAHPGIDVQLAGIKLFARTIMS